MTMIDPTINYPVPASTGPLACIDNGQAVANIGGQLIRINLLEISQIYHDGLGNTVSLKGIIHKDSYQITGVNFHYPPPENYESESLPPPEPEIIKENSEVASLREW